VERDGWALQFAAPELQNDEEVVLAATRKDPTIILQVMPELQNDRNVVIKAVQQDWRLLESLKPELRAVRAVILAAVRQTGWALQYVPRERLADREIVLEALRNHGDALRFAAPELCSDREVVLTAVRQSGTALGLASKGVQDMEIATAAVKQDRRALVFVAKRLLPDVLKYLGLDRMPAWATGTQGHETGGSGEHTGVNLAGASGNLEKHFATLELPATASKDEIRKKYHQLALQYHPDKCSGDAEFAKEMFQKIQQAYETLHDALNL